MAIRNKFAAVAVILLIGGTSTRSLAQYDSEYPEPLPPLAGTLFLHGGGNVSSEMRQQFVQAAGGQEARIVVIPTASSEEPLDESRLEVWREFSPKSVEFLHVDSREQVDASNFEEILDKATGVWFGGGDQSRLAERDGGTIVEEGILKLLLRGGVVGGTSAGAAIASKIMLVADEIHTGFDLLPGAIVDQHFTERQRVDRLIRAVDQHPDRVGFGIDESTMLIVRDRRLVVVGEANVTVVIAASQDRPARREILEPGMQYDLVSLRRTAQARRMPAFPPKQVVSPKLTGGSLIIAGGGQLLPEVIQEFVQLAGGDESHIVYIPCEEAKVILSEPQMLEDFRRTGSKDVVWLHTKDRGLANDPHFVEPLAKATGIWFGGGRQWNFVDSYQNTEAHRLLHAVLERGGVIGGSSAGASIQGDFMPRGDPMGNTTMMAEGYERGLGFMRGVAIDQHFAQRNRFPDMAFLKRTHPQLLGIGIDEGTCLLVQENMAKVSGAGQVSFFGQPIDSEELDSHISLGAGGIYDLELRKVISVAVE